MTPAERTEMLRVRLRPAEADKLRELAARDDEPVSAVVRRALRRYIEDTERTDHKRKGRA
jgi:predicted transcriptional regulator